MPVTRSSDTPHRFWGLYPGYLRGPPHCWGIKDREGAGRREAGPSSWTLDVPVKGLDTFPQGKEALKGSDYILERSRWLQCSELIGVTERAMTSEWCQEGTNK